MKSAIIGCGGISRTHINAILKTKSEIVALCDIDVIKAQKIKEEFNLNAEIYQDYQKILEKDIDVVHILTPHYLHAEMAYFFLKKNINVLSEKPMGITLNQLKKIEKIAKKSQAQYGVCLQNRYNPTSLWLYNYLKDKKVTYAHADICWHRDEKYYDSDYWRGKKKLEGGGVLINQAIHTLDLLQWFCGRPKSVVADINNFSLKDKIEVEDSAMVLFKGEKSSYSIFATNSAKTDLSPIINLKLETGENIILSKDRLIVDNKIIEIKDDINIYGKRCYGNGHEHLISDFYYKIEKKKKFEIDAEEAIVSSKMVLYAYKSRGKIKIIEE